MKQGDKFRQDALNATEARSGLAILASERQGSEGWFYNVSVQGLGVLSGVRSPARLTGGPTVDVTVVKQGQLWVIGGGTEVLNSVAAIATQAAPLRGEPGPPGPAAPPPDKATIVSMLQGSITEDALGSSLASKIEAIFGVQNRQNQLEQQFGTLQEAESVLAQAQLAQRGASHAEQTSTQAAHGAAQSQMAAAQAKVDATLAAQSAEAERLEAQRQASLAASSQRLAESEASKAAQAAIDSLNYKNQAEGSATSAQGSASAASGSASQASSSAGDAAQSATAAQGFMTTAQTLADNAETSASAAAESASSAAASQTEAGRSASAAHSSQLAADAAAGQAGKSAEASSISAGSASASSDSASKSASAAQTSALNAKASEDSATQSAAAAVSSKEQADASASAAGQSASAAHESEVAAAASSQAASDRAGEAAYSAQSAHTSRQEASGFASQAGGSAAAASQSETQANIYNQQAETAASAAITAKESAQGFSDTASQYADASSQSALSAGTSANRASDRADSAVLAAQQAQSSSEQAGQFAAASQESAVQADVVVERGVMRLSLNDDFSLGALGWVDGDGSSEYANTEFPAEPYKPTRLVNDPTATAARLLRLFGTERLFSERWIPVDTSLTYRISARWRAHQAPEYSNTYLVVMCFDAQGAHIPPGPVPGGTFVYPAIQNVNFTEWREVAVELTGERDLSNGDNARWFRPGTKYVRIGVLAALESYSCAIDLDYLRFEEVTSEVKARNSADAAAFSASESKASATDSGLFAAAASRSEVSARASYDNAVAARDAAQSSADAANSSKEQASGFAGQAYGSANAAKESATKAEASYGQAAQAAGTAAGSAQDASNFASASNTAKEQASGFADQALSSANASSSSAISAQSAYNKSMQGRNSSFQSGLDGWYSDPYADYPIAISPHIYRIVPAQENSDGPILEAGPGSIALYGGQRLPISRGRFYRMKVRAVPVSHTSNNRQSIYAGMSCFLKTGALYHNEYFCMLNVTSIPVTGDFQVFEGILDCSDLLDRYNDLSYGTPIFLANFNDGSGDSPTGSTWVDYVEFEEVSESIKAGFQASAAASSASTAKSEADRSKGFADAVQESSISAGAARDAASQYAGAAQQSASTASGYLSNAEAAAASASSNANIASTKAGEASGSADAAVQSANKAQGYSNESRASAASAAESVLSARAVLHQGPINSNPSFRENALGWSRVPGGAEFDNQTYSFWTNDSYFDGGAIRANHSLQLFSKAAVSVGTGRRFKFKATFVCHVAPADGLVFYIGAYLVNNQGAYPFCSAASRLYVTGEVVTIEGELTSAMMEQQVPGVKHFHLFALMAYDKHGSGGVSGVITDIEYFSVEDITESSEAAKSAAAAVVKASEASASADTANNRAAAADSARTLAETAQGKAEAAQLSAANSASDASWAMQQASTFAQNASNSAETAVGSASNASQSAASAQAWMQASMQAGAFQSLHTSQYHELSAGYGTTNDGGRQFTVSSRPANRQDDPTVGRYGVRIHGVNAVAARFYIPAGSPALMAATLFGASGGYIYKIAPVSAHAYDRWVTYVWDMEMSDGNVSGFSFAEPITGYRVAITGFADTPRPYHLDWVSVGRLSAEPKAGKAEVQAVVDQMGSEIVLKVQSDKTVAGVGLRADANGSAFGVLADSFFVKNNANGNTKTPFIVKDGQVQIDGNLIATGTIQASQLQTGATNLVHNVTLLGTQGPWSYGGPAGGGFISDISQSGVDLKALRLRGTGDMQWTHPNFPVEPGKAYEFSVSIYMNDGSSQPTIFVGAHCFDSTGNPASLQVYDLRTRSFSSDYAWMRSNPYFWFGQLATGSFKKVRGLLLPDGTDPRSIPVTDADFAFIMPPSARYAGFRFLNYYNGNGIGDALFYNMSVIERGGSTVIRGDQITTGKITSSNSTSFFDLDNGDIRVGPASGNNLTYSASSGLLSINGKIVKNENIATVGTDKLTGNAGSITGTLIGSGINGGNITVGTISAARLDLSGVMAIGAPISNDQLPTGGITGDKFLQHAPNVVSDPLFGTPGTWNATPQTRTLGGWTGAVQELNSSRTAAFHYNMVSCVPGEVLNVYCEMIPQVNATNSGEIRLYVLSYDASGSNELMHHVATVPANAMAANSWRGIGGSVTVPAGQTRFRFYVTHVNTGYGLNSLYLRFPTVTQPRTVLTSQMVSTGKLRASNGMSEIDLNQGSMRFGAESDPDMTYSIGQGIQLKQYPRLLYTCQVQAEKGFTAQSQVYMRTDFKFSFPSSLSQLQAAPGRVLLLVVAPSAVGGSIDPGYTDVVGWGTSFASKQGLVFSFHGQLPSGQKLQDWYALVQVTSINRFNGNAKVYFLGAIQIWDVPASAANGLQMNLTSVAHA